MIRVENRLTGELIMEIESLRKANLRWTDLRGADLCGSDLREADLRWTNLRKADLRWTDLREANLCGSTLRNADLRGVNLRGADLRGADLRGVNLRGASFENADLRGADLWEADLRGVDLRGASLRGASLRHIKLPSSIPVIEDVHKAVAYAVTADGNVLDMSNWHGDGGFCGTTHCRAGWVVHLAGEKGRELEKTNCTPIAAALIYQASDPELEKVPDFYAGDDDSMADIMEMAERG